MAKVAMSLEMECALPEPGRFSDDALTELALARRDVRATRALAAAFRDALGLREPPGSEAMRDLLADLAGGPHVACAPELTDPLERQTRLIETLLDLVRSAGVDPLQQRLSRPIEDFLRPRRRAGEGPSRSQRAPAGP